ncbi:MAG: radical SAM protein [Desulfobacterales bacterium]
MQQNFKTMTAQQAARAIIRLLPRISDENLVRLTYLGKWLSDDPEVLKGIEKVRGFLETPGHPAKTLFKRVLEYLPAERRIRLFETLFNGAWFAGGAQRDQWEARLGYRPPFIMILSPTLRCNLRCKGCYTLGYGMKPELSFEVADKLLAECDELGIHFVTILGGEPLVYPHLFPLLQKYPHIFFQVYTNGT